MSCERCLSRRAFLTTTIGATGAVALAACGDGLVSNPLLFEALPGGEVVITVADIPALATPGILVRITGTSVAVKRVDATTFKALSMICTHQGCRIDIVAAGQSFDCSCHDSRFDNDGAVTKGPDTGESIGPLAEFETSYDPATDRLTITS